MRQLFYKIGFLILFLAGCELLFEYSGQSQIQVVVPSVISIVDTGKTWIPIPVTIYNHSDRVVRMMTCCMALSFELEEKTPPGWTVIDRFGIPCFLRCPDQPVQIPPNSFHSDSVGTNIARMKKIPAILRLRLFTVNAEGKVDTLTSPPFHLQW